MKDKKKNVPLIVKKILTVLEEKVKTRQEGNRLRYHIDFETELIEFHSFYDSRAEIKEALQKELGDYAVITYGTYFNFVIVEFKHP